MPDIAYREHTANTQEFQRCVAEREAAIEVGNAERKMVEH